MRSAPSCASAGRLGYTSRDYDQETDTQHDFAGPTGRMSLEWLPGTKTILGFEAYREPRSVIDVAASHLMVAGVSFGPRWAVRTRSCWGTTPAGAAGFRRRSVDRGRDHATDELINLARISVGWEPVRFWQLSAAFDHGERESNVVGRDYQFNAVMANLAYAW